MIGSFHLLHLMFDDYVLFQVEHLHARERASELLRMIKGEEAAQDHPDDLVLPDPSMVSAAFSTNHGSGTLGTDRQTVITDAREAYSMSNSGSRSFLKISTCLMYINHTNFYIYVTFTK